jgi:hypothetical protein
METKNMPRLLAESVDTDSTDATAATIVRPLHDTYYLDSPRRSFSLVLFSVRVQATGTYS